MRRLLDRLGFTGPRAFVADIARIVYDPCACSLRLLEMGWGCGQRRGSQATTGTNRAADTRGLGRVRDDRLRLLHRLSVFDEREEFVLERAVDGL